jgi:hypothetical protein
MNIARGTVRAYLDGLKSIAAVSGATEHTYREPLVRFLVEASKDLGLGAIDVHGELRLALVGQPDLQVVNAVGSPIGYGETKVPGSASDFAKVLESEQIGRYRKSLENLLVTDFIHFALFRTDIGRLDATLIETPARMAAGAPAVSQPVLDQFSQLLASFFSASAPSATSVEQLAQGLARRTTLLRDAIRVLVTSTNPDGEALRRLWDFYRRSLMSDMEADDFADTYAQTLIYALFLVRLDHGPLVDLDAAWRAIPRDVPILRSAIEPLRAAGRLPDALAVWLQDSLHLLAATPDAVIATIGHPSAGTPDPILYFYENFLAAYDRVERIRKGVYYTPRPLVDYLVRAVHETLKSSFSKALGLADQDVRLLDPALGTGTFLLAAAQTAADEIEANLGPGAVQTVLEDHVLRHFYGFELLPAPYTISHIKLALFARDKAAQFLDKRAQVFLTNTLGDPLQRADDGGLLAFFVPGLIEEAAAAERVKADQPILVVIGNPPWSASSHNKQPEIERIFRAWKTVDGRPGSPLIEDARIALNDDYLKFLRWAVWKVVEQPAGARHGIVAFVTNHGFVNGRIHRGVRKALIDAFDEIYVFNLHGNQRLWVKGVVDEKVFPDVQQGVAMTVLIRRGAEHEKSARVRYREMRGSRVAKYAAAASAGLGDEKWVDVLPAAPMWSFVPRADEASYQTWPSIQDLFPVNNSGVKTERDDAVSDTGRDALESKVRLLLDADLSAEKTVELTGVREKSNWTVASKRSAFAPWDPDRIITWLYRVFDRRFLYWDPAMMGRPAVKVMRHLLPKPFGFGGEGNLALVVQRARPITTIATVTRGIATADVTSYWGYVYPFYLLGGQDEEQHLLASALDRQENLSRTIISPIEKVLGRTLTVEDIGWYVFAILSAPAFRRRFAVALHEDHPRIPFPRLPTLFEEIRDLGEQLARVHLGEVPVGINIRFEGSGTSQVDEVRYDSGAESVWVNRTQRFAGLPADAWAWGGSFRPLEHYLTDRRGRRLDADQIGAFQSAIHAVRESMRLEPSLDRLLERALEEPMAFPAN